MKLFSIIYKLYSNIADVHIFCTEQLKLLAINTTDYNIITQLLKKILLNKRKSEKMEYDELMIVLKHL